MNIRIKEGQQNIRIMQPEYNKLNKKYYEIKTPYTVVEEGSKETS